MQNNYEVNHESFQTKSSNGENTPSIDSQNNNNKVNVIFGNNLPEEEYDDSSKKEDLSKYTVVDHLDEDVPVKGQEFCLFSFLSPEGVMNCNVRAVKFRGAYPTLEGAEKAAREIENKDKYFKIFVGESGKWLDFDPPSSKVEREMSSNKEHQKILDAQRKQRMDKINTLAGKHKDNVNVKESGKKERIDEGKKASAASDLVEKQKAKNQESDGDTQQPTKLTRKAALEKTKDRLRKKLEDSQSKKQSAKENTWNGVSDSNLNEKIKIVNKAYSDIADNKASLEKADQNIANIKQLLEKRRAKK